MKKIGICTLYYQNRNYGANLQAYALRYTLEKLGVNAELVPYYYRTRVRRLLSSIKQSLKKNRISKNVEKRNRVIDKFNNLIPHSKVYYSNTIHKANKYYDCFITGSDQVWNPTQPYCLEPYFLTFVPKGKKKISYASSIGVTELLENEKQDFRRWLSSYDAISVREHQAKELLASFIEKPVVQVADPTFLLDSGFWKKIAVYSRKSEPYILLFTVGFDSNLLQFAIKISNESGLRLIYLNELLSEPIDRSYEVVNDAGPREFLGLIAHAEMVITDSYHATVFSLIMETKNFYTYIASCNKRGSRILDLLETYQTKNHLLLNDLSENYDDLSNRKIDYNLIRKIYKEEQIKAHAFLKNALS